MIEPPRAEPETAGRTADRNARNPESLKCSDHGVPDNFTRQEHSRSNPDANGNRNRQAAEVADSSTNSGPTATVRKSKPPQPGPAGPRGPSPRGYVKRQSRASGKCSTTTASYPPSPYPPGVYASARDPGPGIVHPVSNRSKGLKCRTLLPTTPITTHSDQPGPLHSIHSWEARAAHGLRLGDQAFVT